MEKLIPRYAGPVLALISTVIPCQAYIALPSGFVGAAAQIQGGTSGPDNPPFNVPALVVTNAPPTNNAPDMIDGASVKTNQPPNWTPDLFMSAEADYFSRLPTLHAYTSCGVAGVTVLDPRRYAPYGTSGDAEALFADTITISTNTIPKIASLVFLCALDGDLFTSPSDMNPISYKYLQPQTYASASITVRLGKNASYQSLVQTNGEMLGVSGRTHGHILASTPLSLGTKIRLTVDLDASAQIATIGVAPGTAFSDFSQTVTVEGFQFYDANTNLLTVPPGSVTINSALGINYPILGPMLSILPATNAVTVFWPNAPGWTLEQNSTLAATNGWTASSGVTTAGGTNYWTSSFPRGALFLRLRNP